MNEVTSIDCGRTCPSESRTDLSPSVVLLLLSLAPIVVLADDAPSKPAEVTAFEECVALALTTATEVSEVGKQCATEMKAFVSRKNANLQEKIRQRTAATAERERRLMAEREHRAQMAATEKEDADDDLTLPERDQ